MNTEKKQAVNMWCAELLGISKYSIIQGFDAEHVTIVNHSEQSNYTLNIFNEQNPAQLIAVVDALKNKLHDNIASDFIMNIKIHSTVKAMQNLAVKAYEDSL